MKTAKIYVLNIFDNSLVKSKLEQIYDLKDYGIGLVLCDAFDNKKPCTSNDGVEAVTSVHTMIATA